MATALERLLDSIDPERTLEEQGRRADRALNAFTSPSLIEDWDAFRACLVRFVADLDGHLLRLPGGRPPSMGFDFDWGRCTQLLMHAYGHSGEKAAFEMARTGNEGGLRAVLRKMAMTRSEQFVENEVAARANTYWDGLSADERLAAGEEYLAKYGHLLPSELTEGSAARVRANLPRVLQEHPQLMEKLRQATRR
ncbi:MAG: hypothetical protein ISS72_09060 [Candidatus Brocadiae bacterium]|nr:hypothetical protein [Candidatus Brocadiia bacterium]